MTNYPEIFRNTYWGVFSCEGREDYMKPIFENRNRFAEKFPTIKNANYKKSKHRYFFELIFERVRREGTNDDHIEYYDTGYSFIGISSHHCNESNHATWQKYGFRLFDPLYAPDQSTYMYEYFYKSPEVEKQLKDSQEMKLMFEAMKPNKKVSK